MISIKDVSFQYQSGKDDGLEDFCLTIAPGECVLLCGRSGCGKTTVTRLINGLVPHFYPGMLQGQVTVGGMEIAQTPMYRIAQEVGSVFQNPRTQFFNVDTDSEIVFGMENLSYPREQMEERLNRISEELKIGHLLGNSIFELSGGEKQKIAFASVYAMNPDVYLMDEPSSNLDTDAIEDFKRTLFLLKEQGKTVVIAEHRLYYLKDLVDRIVYLDEKKIAGIYRPKEFLQFTQKQRAGMGLRTMELDDLAVRKSEPVQKAPVLEIKNLSLFHKSRCVLEGISVSAAPGEVIGVIGHNGAGKSTFLRTLCGLHRQYEGEFWWKGKRVGDKERLKLSYLVMQDVGYQLFAESVEEECMLGIRNPDLALCDSTLCQLELEPYRKRHPNTLSGGQKQRTAVAVSVICKKKILIFDEPTSGLDYDSMIRVSQLISRLAQEGKIIFVVTHDYEFLTAVCSRVLHLDEGKLQSDFSMDSSCEKRLQSFFLPDRQEKTGCP